MAIYPLTLFYDSACPLCRLEMDHLRMRDSNAKLRFIDIAAPDFDPRLHGVALQDLMNLIHAKTPDGRLIRGIEVLRHAYAAVGLGWITTPMGWPFLRKFFDQAYAGLAHNRYMLSRRFAWIVNAVAARRALRRMHACKSGNCRL